MQEKKPTNTTKTTKTRKPHEVELVHGAMLTEFINVKLGDIAKACQHVAEEKKDVEQADLHCQYYLDGAKEVARRVLELVPPVLASDLLKVISATVNTISVNKEQIAKDFNVDEGFVMSFASGARQFGDIVIKGLKDAAAAQTKTLDKKLPKERR